MSRGRGNARPAPSPPPTLLRIAFALLARRIAHRATGGPAPGVGGVVAGSFDPNLALRRAARGLAFGRLARGTTREVHVVVAVRKHVIAVGGPAAIAVRALVALAKLTRLLVTRRTGRERREFVVLKVPRVETDDARRPIDHRRADRREAVAPVLPDIDVQHHHLAGVRVDE